MAITTQDDFGQTTENAPATQVSGNVLANDGSTQGAMTVAAINGDPAKVGATLSGTYGTFRVNADGSFVYTRSDAPNTNALAVGQTGYDTVSYTVRNTAGEQALASLQIAIQGINDSPTGRTDALAVFPLSREARGVITMSDPDTGDTVTLTSVGGAGPSETARGRYGTLTFTADGQFVYTQDPATAPAHLHEGETAQEFFTYTVTDNHGESVTLGPIAITVRGYDAPPEHSFSEPDELLMSAGGVLRMETAELGDGGAMVFWSNRVSIFAPYRMQGQVVDANGEPVGSPFLIYASDSDLGPPSSTGLAGGGAVVTFRTDTGSAFQLYDAAGNPSGGIHALSGPGLPLVEALPNGGFVLGYGQTFQVFDATGTAASGPIAIAPGMNPVYPPQYVIGDGGEITVVWDNMRTDTYIRIRTFSETGVPLTGELVAGQLDRAEIDGPVSALALDDGKLLFYWSESNADVRGILFDSSSGAHTPPFNVVSDLSVAERMFVIEKVEGGGFAAVWSESTFNGGATPDPAYPYGPVRDALRVQVFDGNANRVGGSFQIVPHGSAATNGLTDLALVAHGDGSLSVFWTTPLNASESKIYSSQVSFDATPYHVIGSAVANTIRGDGAENWLAGLAGNDLLYGGGGDDTLEGGAGDDTMNGGDGFDFALFSGNRADYALSVTGGETRVEGADGIDTVVNVERLQFADGVYRLAPSGGYEGSALLTDSFGASAAAGGWVDYRNYPRMAADIDGDGQADLAGFGSGGVYAALTGSAGEAGPTYLAINGFGADVAAGGWIDDRNYPRTFGDIDGDGLADIVGFGSGGVYVSLATGNGQFGPVSLALAGFGADAAAGGWVDSRAYPRTTADINGDGLDDLVGFGGAGVYAALATGGGHFGAVFLAAAAFGRDAAAGGWSDDNLYPRLLADIDGDGDDDLIGFGVDGTFAALANGDGTFGEMYLAYERFGSSSAAGGWSSNDQYFRTAGDTNGDGLEDLIGFGQAGVFVALADGSGHFLPGEQVLGSFGTTPEAGGWTSQNAFPRTVADLDGDGAVDLIGFGDAGVFVAMSASDWIVV